MKPDADLSVEGVAKLVANFLEALDLRDVTLVGNDSGGAICQLVAGRHNERVGRLVLTTCDAYEVFPPPLFGYLTWLPKIPGLTAVLAKSMLHVPALRQLPLAYGLLTERRIPDDVLTKYVRPCATNAGIRRDVEKFSRTVSRKVTLEAAEDLKNFRQPALILWTPEDRFFPISLAERLARDLPNARLVRIADARVFVAEDQPERVTREIEEFIRKEAVQAATPTMN